MTRAGYARLASDGVANHYDDKLDHLQDAITALDRHLRRLPTETLLGATLPVVRKVNQLQQRLGRLQEERHVAVKTAYDLAWGQYPGWRFQQDTIAKLSAQAGRTTTGIEQERFANQLKSAYARLEATISVGQIASQYVGIGKPPEPQYQYLHACRN